MKVAFLGHKQIPSRSGGVEVVVSELAPRIATLGFDVVAYNRRLCHLRSPHSCGGVRLVDVGAPRIRGIEALIYSYIATVRAIADRVDVMHYHAIGPSGACWLAKLARKRVVVTVHGLNYEGAKWGSFASRYLRFCERVALRCADEVIVLSDTVRELYGKRYGRDVHVIANGVSLPEHIPGTGVLDRFDLAARGYVLCVSRIVPGKGLEELIPAFLATDSRAKLVLVGDNSDNPSYADALRAKYSGEERVLFTGQLERDDVYALYAQARIFVLASHAEGMSMSLLEAMALDCPVLASDIPENRELLGPFGDTFPVGDRDALSHALEEILRAEFVPPETSGPVRAGHNWDDIAEKTALLYRRGSR